MDISELTQALNAAANALPAGLKEEDRLACLAACNKLQQKLENPLEAFLRHMLGVTQGTALRLGTQMQLLETAIVAKGPITAKALAEVKPADPELVRRVMRVLVAMQLFDETGKDTYVANPIAAAFIPPSPLHAGIMHVGTSISVVASLPEYFAKTGFLDPGNAFDGPWQHVYQTKDHYFEWLAKRPELQQAFNTVMTISRSAHQIEEWFKIYPVAEKLKVASPQDVLLVDIGGGIGHDLIAFKNEHPNLQGRLILEDLPSVVEEAKDLPSGIEKIGHSFFDPQPSSLQHAKAYYLRTVLHDWPDKQAKIILEKIRDVMSEGSVLLINENALPNIGVPLYAAQLDFQMMACFASLERTEQQFVDLLDASGFTLVKIWRSAVDGPGSTVLFEAVVKG